MTDETPSTDPKQQIPDLSGLADFQFGPAWARPGARQERPVSYPERRSGDRQGGDRRPRRDNREEYGGKIINQLKKLGASADWERERFTMDEGCSKAVQEVFIRLYEKGYIYKGSRIINWCPVCQTSISDAEVVHEDQDGFFWHINYPIVGEEGRFVEIATTRPETLLGDTAVAVNPEDERYQDLVGKMLKLPLTDREIPVIADSYVDKEFGTGCVKITPAHDPKK